MTDVKAKIKYSDNGETTVITYDDDKKYTIEDMPETEHTQITGILKLVEEIKVWLNHNGAKSIKVEEEE